MKPAIRIINNSLDFTDTQILDWLADDRIFDAIHGVDIDEASEKRSLFAQNRQLRPFPIHPAIVPPTRENAP